ncbi:hypothetical protein [Pseudobacteriovorax antillogorgiicola]|uniref:Periplasmic nitrate reductase chaperone NapD n=1 Tax=Pseudobacteriovorax antillogorgiicola TaxID=1513793 RepID=A0A1Y6C8T4_9BACT|nr:hypothetical protein [Pseudobacteriovorax antillogorgiicola]TCS49787.1 periplasmic nitrate reductase chaperone NapD [Pseudobacteriovorax antillogorgiicola]SMF42919.1 periplasmic nitrate reductase chaperone NapD [Pseudobacteriovorax antillogorgiicola]
MTNTSLIPDSFQSWRECIEVRCQVPLTKEYCEKRIVELKNAKEFNTKKFIECYGAEHHRRVLSWFEQGLKGLSS